MPAMNNARNAPLSRIDNSSHQTVIDFKAASFKVEHYKAAIEYELKRARVVWNRAARHFQCPEGVAGGGRFTNRMGLGCGAGVVRRAMRGIGDSLDDATKPAKARQRTGAVAPQKRRAAPAKRTVRGRDRAANLRDTERHIGAVAKHRAAHSGRRRPTAARVVPKPKERKAPASRVESARRASARRAGTVRSVHRKRPDATVPMETPVPRETHVVQESYKKILRREFPGADFWVGEDGSHRVVLSRIVVPHGAQSEGWGTAFMERLVQLADERGDTITLTPTTDFGASSVARLQKFYRRFGFVPNKGKDKDYAISDTMYRIPKVRAEGPSVAPKRRDLLEDGTPIDTPLFREVRPPIEDVEERAIVPSVVEEPQRVIAAWEEGYVMPPDMVAEARQTFLGEIRAALDRKGKEGILRDWIKERMDFDPIEVDPVSAAEHLSDDLSDEREEWAEKYQKALADKYVRPLSDTIGEVNEKLNNARYRHRHLMGARSSLANATWYGDQRDDEVRAGLVEVLTLQIEHEQTRMDDLERVVDALKKEDAKTVFEAPELPTNPLLPGHSYNPRWHGVHTMGYEMDGSVSVGRKVLSGNKDIYTIDDAVRHLREGGALDDVPDSLVKGAIRGNPQRYKVKPVQEGVNSESLTGDPLDGTALVIDTDTGLRYFIKTPKYHHAEYQGEIVISDFANLLGVPAPRTRIVSGVRGKEDNYPVLAEAVEQVVPGETFEQPYFALDSPRWDGTTGPYAGTSSGKMVILLDRMFSNGDRNAGNFKVLGTEENPTQIVPIDNGAARIRRVSSDVGINYLQKLASQGDVDTLLMVMARLTPANVDKILRGLEDRFPREDRGDIDGIRVAMLRLIDHLPRLLAMAKEVRKRSTQPKKPPSPRELAEVVDEEVETYV